MYTSVNRGTFLFHFIWFSLALIIVTYTSGFQPVLGEGFTDNEECYVCHSNTNLEMAFPSGEVISIFVDRDEYESSVHGEQGMACITCHAGTTEYPHQPRTELNYRDYSLDLYAICTRCHTEQIAEIRNNVHMVALAAGNPNAAVCTDCHGTHNILCVSEAITPMNRTCGTCHGEINELYELSVHGAALIGDGNPDVPSCTDCHGSHEIIGPSNYPFHLFSPQICGDCHSDRDLMESYGINPNVMDSYVSDFHGKTVIIFETVASDQETNKPVCIDCHGVHDMLSPEDSHSSVLKENLLVTCQKCHPDASANFPDSWLSHYNPGPDQIRPVFYVKVIYWILIPLLVGAMALYVVSDFVRQWLKLKGEMKDV